jgi:cyclic beta-1,2-glucan synthetase
MTVLVSPEDDIEIRDVVVHNLTDTAAVHELVSYLEPVLATQAADDAHPAFFQPVRRAARRPWPSRAAVRAASAHGARRVGPSSRISSCPSRA